MKGFRGTDHGLNVGRGKDRLNAGLDRGDDQDNGHAWKSTDSLRGRKSLMADESAPNSAPGVPRCAWTPTSEVEAEVAWSTGSAPAAMRV